MEKRTLVNTPEKYESAVSYINEHSEIVNDTETDGLDWVKENQVVGVSTLAGERSFYFPFRHKDGVNLPENLLADYCERVLRPDRPHGGFNYSFDVKMLSKEGMCMPTDMWDSILSAHMLNENEPSFKMENLAAKYLDAKYAGDEDALLDLLQEKFGGSRKTCKKNLHRLDPVDVYDYACQDVETTRDLRDFHMPYLAEWELTELTQDVFEFQRYVLEMEMRGVRLDLDLLHELRGRSGEMSAKYEKEIEEMAGYPLNPRSPKQVCAWLGVQSSSKHALHAMQDDPRVVALQQYRFWSKVDSSYYTPYLNRVSEDGRMRYNLRVGGTTTGRLSASNPNINAVPRDPEMCPVKDVFIADEDHEIVEIDYSQAELRFCAHYSQDPTFCDMILSGADMHQLTADKVGVPRNPTAKNINFSVWYNIGWRTFARTYHVEPRDAKKWLADYHAWIPGVRRLIKSAERQAERQGYIRMYTGRARRFNTHRAATYTASSGLIQGGVAEMLRIAMMRIRRELPHVKIYFPIHDAGLFGVPKKGADETIDRMREIMQDQPWCSIPMLVDCKRGDRWGKTMTEIRRTTLGVPQHALEKCTDPSIMGDK